MKIKVKVLDNQPVLYLWHAMNIECLAYTDYPKGYYYWAENEEHAREQLKTTLAEVKESEELGNYSIERVWADGLEGGCITKE